MNLKNYPHIMLDIETLGTEPGCAITSIGAVMFNINTGKKEQVFYKAITIDSNVATGLKLNPNTVAFWLQQPKAAQKRLFDNPESLSIVLQDFAKWLQQFGEDFYVWGNGASFDCAILKAAYNALGQPQPWKFRNELDLRTIVAFNPDIKANMPFAGVKHDPIADCLHQIKYLVATIKSITAQDPGEVIKEDAPNTAIKAPRTPKTTLLRILHCKRMSPLKSDPNNYYKQDIKKFENDIALCNKHGYNYMLANVSNLTNTIKLFDVESYTTDKGFTYSNVLRGERHMLDKFTAQPNILVRGI